MVQQTSGGDTTPIVYDSEGRPVSWPSEAFTAAMPISATLLDTVWAERTTARTLDALIDAVLKLEAALSRKL